MEKRFTNAEAASLTETLEKLNKLLYLDLVLLEAEASVGLMDGMPLPGGKEEAFDKTWGGMI